MHAQLRSFGAADAPPTQQAAVLRGFALWILVFD